MDFLLISDVSLYLSLRAKTKHLAFSLPVPSTPLFIWAARAAQVWDSQLFLATSSYVCNSFHTNKLPIFVTVEVRALKLLLQFEFIYSYNAETLRRVCKVARVDCGGGEGGTGRAAFPLLLIYETATDVAPVR